MAAPFGSALANFLLGHSSRRFFRCHAPGSFSAVPAAVVDRIGSPGPQDLGASGAVTFGLVHFAGAAGQGRGHNLNGVPSSGARSQISSSPPTV